MLATIQHKERTYRVDLVSPIDISLPLAAGPGRMSAWYVPPLVIGPVQIGEWVGDIEHGASVNFRNITFNPHGHGTHTECVGHISKEPYSINQCLKQFFFMAELISVEPALQPNGDRVITAAQIRLLLNDKRPEAVVIRTLPNGAAKETMHYSNSNPPYIHHDAIKVLLEAGVEHLLIDLPSVDKEVDEGQLLAHKAFWGYPQDTQIQRTITELIYVPGHVPDGSYLLNIQIAPFENDATPSKPVLYKLI